MGKDSKESIQNKDDNALPDLLFPDFREGNKKEAPISLEQIIILSEQMLPFENRRRKPSRASSYIPFVLR